jgi:hypothetical protein
MSWESSPSPAKPGRRGARAGQCGASHRETGRIASRRRRRCPRPRRAPAHHAGGGVVAFPRRGGPGPGAGQHRRRLGDRVVTDGEEPDSEASPHVAQHRGMSLHADDAVPARDRRRLERLCRYVARPPLAHDRLDVRPEGRLALRLETRWTALARTRAQWIAPTRVEVRHRSAPCRGELPGPSSSSVSSRSMRFAAPRCGAQMRQLAAIDPPRWPARASDASGFSRAGCCW